MSAPTQDRGALICALRGWIERLEAGGSVDAPPALSELLQPQEQAFYRQVAELTRRLHTAVVDLRSEEHTSELQSLMRISYAVFCLKKKKRRTMSKQINTRGQQQKI